MANKLPSVHIAALTHPGKVRRHNEDCIVVNGWMSQAAMEQPQTFLQTLDEPLLCLVADGMGGHASGEIASRYVARRLSKETPHLAASETALTEGLRRIHQAFSTEMQRLPECAGMGTTVAGLIFSQQAVLVFNVGDSRIYQRQGNSLTQLSTDDVPEKTAYGIKARTSHAITQSLGGYTDMVDINPHIVSQRLKARRDYLLCSDGVTDMVHVKALRACLSDDPVNTVTALFEKAMAAGGRDNITIIAVRIQG